MLQIIFPITAMDDHSVVPIDDRLALTLQARLPGSLQIYAAQSTTAKNLLGGKRGDPRNSQLCPSAAQRAAWPHDLM